MYLDNQSPEVKKNAEILVKRMNAKGITNPVTQAGLLAIISKESGFIPRNETSYSTTSVARIRSIFGSRVAGLSDAQIEALKKDDKAFYEQVYGMQWNSKLGLGQESPGDGYRYRGRGFNGITGKALYRKYAQKTGVDIVSNPDLLNDIAVASDVAIEYFKDVLGSRLGKQVMANYYNNPTGDINKFKTASDSTGAFYHANAGLGNSLTSLQADPTGGRKKAMSRSEEFLEYAKKYAGQTIDIVKKKPIETIILTALIVVAGYFLYKTLIKKNKQ